MPGQLSDPPWQVRRFGHWVAQSRWWPEDAVVLVNRQTGAVESVAAPPLRVSAPPPAGVRFPTVLVVRYLTSPVGELLADGAARLPTGADGKPIPMDTTPEVIKTATLAFAELLVDIEPGLKGDTVVCRQLTIRPGDAKGRWTLLPWPLKRLVDPSTGNVLPSSDGGRLYGLGRLPVEEMLERYLSFWGYERGLKPGRRSRKFTSAVLEGAARIARENPSRPVRAVADQLQQLGLEASEDPENRRQVAQRLINRAVREGKVAADLPGLRRKQQAAQLEGEA